MGKKNKQRGGKKPNPNGGVQPQGVRGTIPVKAFKVSLNKATKAKHKAKTVTTKLKRLNVQNRQQVTQSDTVFTELQKTMKTTHKGKQTTETSTAKMPAKPTTKKEAPNMDEASELMACL